MQRAHLRIALLHHTGGGNLGDQASVDAVLSNIRQRWPGSEVSLLSMNPTETERVHGIPSYPLRTYVWQLASTQGSRMAKHESNIGFVRWLQSIREHAIRVPKRAWREILFLAKSVQIVRQFDLLIVSGGGQLTGKSGPWGFPYAIFAWFLAAKVTCTRCMFLNVGAGPLTDPLSKCFAICTLRAASYVSFRDEASQRLTRTIGFKGVSDVYPDNVYSLNVRSLSTLGTARSDRRVVGIAPLAYPARPACATSDQKASYDDVIAKFATFTSSLIAQQSYSVTFFGTDVEEDAATIEDLRKVLRDRHKLRTPPYDPIRSINELLAKMETIDYVVTCRFHAVVFAHLLNKPVIAISPHPKVADHMSTLGMSQYCIDIQRFDANILMGMLYAVVRDEADIKARMDTSLVKFRSLLKEQLDGLFPTGPEYSVDRRLFKVRSLRGEAES